MNIFLTGATGYIGSTLTDKLLAAGHTLSGLARSDTSAATLKAKGVQVVQGSLTDRDLLTAQAKAADVVIHLAVDYFNPEGGEWDAAATQALVDGLSGSAKTLIYTSTTLVYGNTGTQPARETTPLTDKSAQPWKVTSEQITQSATGLRTVIIRPGFVYGERLPQLVGWFVGAGLQRGSVPFVGEGTNAWAAIHVDDLAELYIAALAQAAAGSVFNGVSGEHFTMRELAETIGEVLGLPASSMPAEEAAAQLGPFAYHLVDEMRVDGTWTQQQLDWQPKQLGFLDKIRAQVQAMAAMQR